MDPGNTNRSPASTGKNVLHALIKLSSNICERGSGLGSKTPPKYSFGLFGVVNTRPVLYGVLT